MCGLTSNLKCLDDQNSSTTFISMGIIKIVVKYIEVRSFKAVYKSLITNFWICVCFE